MSAFSDSSAIEKLFLDIPIEGSIVVSNLDGTKVYSYNDARARKPHTVASTFKIANTLIALEDGVVTNKFEVFPWNGVEHEVKSWNRDQTLETAFKVSCVWCYQKIARGVGTEKYIKYLGDYEYGNLPETFKVDEFWLDGSLKLNSYEQISFLKNVYRNEPTFGTRAYKTLKEIMLVDKASTYSIYAKTGWSPYGDDPVGWYIGYVEKGGDVWFFVTNLEIKKMRNLILRKEITYRVLKSINVLPNA